MTRYDWPDGNQGGRGFGREHGDDDARPHPDGGRRRRDASPLPRAWGGTQDEGGAGDLWRGMAHGDSALFGASEADYADGRRDEGRWNRRGYPDDEERALRDYGAHARGHEYQQPGWQGNTLYGVGDPDRAPSPPPSRAGYGRDWRAPWVEARGGQRRPEPRAGSYRGRGPRNYARSDERITEDLNERLTDNDMLDASDISVQVVDGVATLSGSVASRWMRHLAEDIADSCGGVKDIRNEITVAGAARGARDAAPGGGLPA